MIRPEALRAVLTVALSFLFLPGLLLFGERPGTAQFVVTVAALAVGAIFTVLVIVIILFSTEGKDRGPAQEEHL
ncbi:MAG TPA: hypothetical protein VHX59_22495 [Mycobacteriales bacterium]|jgi:uncharacterized membrane protein|nr:hypothetical protein [Mycobacteriales bacterium]